MKVGDLVWADYARKRQLGLIMSKDWRGIRYGRHYFNVMILNDVKNVHLYEDIQLEVISESQE